MRRIVLLLILPIAVIVGLLALSRVFPPLMPLRPASELAKGMMERGQYAEGIALAFALARRPWLTDGQRRALQSLRAWADFTHDPRCVPCQRGEVPPGWSIAECPQIAMTADGLWLFAEEKERMVLEAVNLLRRAGAPACALGLLQSAISELAPIPSRISAWRQAELAPLLDVRRTDEALATARQILDDPLATPDARFWAGLRGTQVLHGQGRMDEGREMFAAALREPVTDEVRRWGMSETGLFPGRFGAGARAAQR